MEPPSSPTPPVPLPPAPPAPSSQAPSKVSPTPQAPHRNYGAVADPAVSLYEMLHIDPQCSPDQVEAGLRVAQRWWNAQQANPKYRRQAGEALARLREARELLLDPIRRQEYDRHHQQFRQSFRARRWQPIRDLLDVLLVDDTCSNQERDLLQRFAAKRGLSAEEIDDLLGEECLKRGIRLLPPPVPDAQQGVVVRRSHHPWITTAMGLSLLGILILPFYGLSRPAILLAFPFFNNLRLLLRDIVPLPDEPAATTPINGWDWVVGIAVLGGATTTSLTELYHSSLFPLGLVTALLAWLAWFGLFSHNRSLKALAPKATIHKEIHDV